MNPQPSRSTEYVMKATPRSSTPVILTVNDYYGIPKSLKRNCIHVGFSAPSISDSVIYLKKVCEMEGIQASEQDLERIAERNRGIRNQLKALDTRTYGGDVDTDMNIWDTIKWFRQGRLRASDIRMPTKELFYPMFNNLEKTPRNMKVLHLMNKYMGKIPDDMLKQMIVNVRNPKESK